VSKESHVPSLKQVLSFALMVGLLFLVVRHPWFMDWMIKIVRGRWLTLLGLAIGIGIGVGVWLNARARGRR